MTDIDALANLGRPVEKVRAGYAAALEAEVATLRSLIQMERQQAAAAEAEARKWKTLADERWEQCAHESRMRDEAEATIERLVLALYAELDEEEACDIVLRVWPDGMPAPLAWKVLGTERGEL